MFSVTDEETEQRENGATPQLLRPQRLVCCIESSARLFGSARARSISNERCFSRKPSRQAFFMPSDEGIGMKSPRQVQKRCLLLILRSGKSSHARSSPYAYDKHVEEQNRLQFMQHGTASARIDEAEESSYSWAICKNSSSRADHSSEKRASYCFCCRGCRSTPRSLTMLDARNIRQATIIGCLAAVSTL